MAWILLYLPVGSMKRLLSIVLFATFLLVPTLASATPNGSGAMSSRQQPMSNARVTYQTRVVPALVDINIRAGNSMARGVTPQTAVVTSIAGHVAGRIIDRVHAYHAERAPKAPQGQPRTPSLTALTAGRWSAYHASTLVPKSATMQPRTSPKGRSNDYQRNRRR